MSRHAPTLDLKCRRLGGASHAATCPSCGGMAVIVGEAVLLGGSLAYHEHQVVEDDGRRSWRPCAGRGTPARLLYLGGGQFRTQVGAL